MCELSRFSVCLVLLFLCHANVASAQPAEPSPSTPVAPVTGPPTVAIPLTGSDEKKSDEKKDDEKKDDKDSGDDAKELDESAFPLMKHGFAVGFGLGMHTAVPYWGGDFDGVASSAFAYLGVFPKYWWGANESNAYCASFRSEAGQRRADSTAIARTVSDLYREALNETYEAWRLLETKDPNDAKKASELLDRARKRKETAEKLSAKKTATDLSQDEVHEIESRRNWTPGIRAACGVLRMFGGFVALPASFSARITSTAEDRSSVREAKPIIAFGGIFAPKPFIHILVGFTWLRVEREIGPEEDRQTREDRTFSAFFGVGTTLDAIAGVFKKGD